MLLEKNKIEPRKFAFFEKRTENFPVDEYSTHIDKLNGMFGEENKTIHRHIDINQFNAVAEPIPQGFTRVKNPSTDWIKDFFFNPNLKYVEPIKVQEYNNRHYFIHDNGGLPFIVYLSEDNIAVVYKIPGDEEDYAVRKDDEENNEVNRQLYQHKVYEEKYTKAFIGKSTQNSLTEFGASYGPDFDGNSILLHISGLEYVEISASIKRFTTLSPVVFYDSSVGNNDVPYPYAEDENKNLYMMLDNVIIPKTDSDLHPYDRFYNSHEMLAYDCVNFENAEYAGYKGFYIDGEPYLMRWESKPGEAYDRLLEFNVDEKEGYVSRLEFLRIDGTKEYVTRDAYIALHERFAQEHGFSTFSTQLIHERLW